jgi:release factor glutamine methyltransferase
MALFAAENGLKIYRRLAKQLAAKLTDNGRLYVEIGFQQAAAVKKIFHQQLPTAKITVKKDITGKDRMIRVCLKSDK